MGGMGEGGSEGAREGGVRRQRERARARERCELFRNVTKYEDSKFSTLHFRLCSFVCKLLLHNARRAFFRSRPLGRFTRVSCLSP